MRRLRRPPTAISALGNGHRRAKSAIGVAGGGGGGDDGNNVSASCLVFGTAYAVDDSIGSRSGRGGRGVRGDAGVTAARADDGKSNSHNNRCGSSDDGNRISTAAGKGRQEKLLSSCPPLFLDSPVDFDGNTADYVNLRESMPGWAGGARGAGSLAQRALFRQGTRGLEEEGGEGGEGAAGAAVEVLREVEIMQVCVWEAGSCSAWLGYWIIGHASFRG